MKRIEQLITRAVKSIGTTRIAMAGVFAVNYILYELVKYWS